MDERRKRVDGPPEGGTPNGAPSGSMALALLLLLLSLCFSGCGDATAPANEVVLFTSLDPIFSEPIVREFETKTGIKVKLQTDSEAAKTVGLVNRLLARKAHPEADVFWNNEVAQTFLLKENGVLEKYVSPSAAEIPERFKDAEGYWTGFAARARVILYNTKLVPLDLAPKTLADLTRPEFKGKIAIARPLFGTTLTHAAALFVTLGDDKAREYFRALQANDVALASGNAQARNLVADGEKAVCLTDTDDAHGAVLKGQPVVMVYPDQAGAGALVIPNSVALIKRGPNPANARKLIDFLLSAQVEAELAKSESVQIPLRPGVAPGSAEFKLEAIKALDVDWKKVSEKLPAVKKFVEEEWIK